jgi:glycosyltransferase involved in cell wall biosynthesis
MIVDPEDEDSIKCAMNELLSNESKRKKFGAKGRKLAIERFSPEVVAEKTLSVYAQILNSA